MQRICRLIPFSLLLLALSACKDQPKNVEPADSLIAPKPSVSPTPAPDAPSNQGNGFENIVADYESKDRVIWQKPDLVIALLGDLTGKTVADVGAGTGYFTFRLLPKAKRVIGVDIDPRFIEFMDSIRVRLPQHLQERFETRLAKPDDPMLKASEADAAMLVNTYGYLDDRSAYLKTLHAGIREGGTLLIIDFKKNNITVGPPDQYRVALSQAEKEIATAGFVITKVDKNTLDYQYIILAEKRKQ